MQDLQALGAAIIAPEDKRLAMTAAALAMPAPLGVIAAAVARHTAQEAAGGRPGGGNRPNPEAPVDKTNIRPELVAVPEVAGGSLERANAILDQHKFRHQVVWHYSSEDNENQVLRQDPVPGKLVERSSTTVILSVANGKPPESREDAQVRKLNEAVAAAIAPLREDIAKLTAVIAKK